MVCSFSQHRISTFQNIRQMVVSVFCDCMKNGHTVLQMPFFLKQPEDIHFAVENIDGQSLQMRFWFPMELNLEKMPEDIGQQKRNYMRRHNIPSRMHIDFFQWCAIL